MKDYTPEGVRYDQIDTALSYQYLIDKKLKKNNRYLCLLTLIGLTSLAFKFKAFKEFLGMKGD